jgi:hypothetical protein
MTRSFAALMRRSAIVGIAIALACVGIGGPAQAVPVTFFGEDLNTNEAIRLAAHPNSDAARAAFLANLVGVGTETFEGFVGDGTEPAPLTLTFPGAGTATLNGDGLVLDLDTLLGSTTLTLTGEYPISGSNYWSSSDFSITFGTPVAAFGFFGTDIGDVGGQLSITLDGAIDFVLDVPHTITGNTGGNVLYFGVIDTDNPFTSITFASSTGADSFGFDDMTIGSLAQVVTRPPQPPAPEIPEPSTWLLVGTGLVGFAAYRRRRKSESL